jgi:hypothetical protein
MLDEARNIRTRFINSKDIFNVVKRLEKEGYIIIEDKYDLTIDSEQVYRLNVFKRDVRLVQVLYYNRQDDTDYKQYIYSVIY